MNKQELEFIKIFNQAICPDDQKSSPQDMKLLNDSIHSEIVEQELQYYCCGLENSLCLLQEEINTLKEQNSRQEQANKTLLNELEALRWQVEYDIMSAFCRSIACYGCVRLGVAKANGRNEIYDHHYGQ